MMNQVESLSLTVRPYAREPGQVIPHAEEDGGPRYTKQEGTGVIPKWKLSAPGLPPNNGLQDDAPQASRA
jgi:hypothetical protein